MMSVQEESAAGGGGNGLLTCITCRVGFRDGDLQRDHYKSDWHRYNLKRKVVDLAPVTAENFQERVDFQVAQQVGDVKDTSQYCLVCKKSYGNAKAYTNHLTSKKHVQLTILSGGGQAKDADSAEVTLANNLETNCVVEGKEKVKGGKHFPPPQVPIPVAHPKGKPGSKMEVDVDDDDDDSWEEVEGYPIPVNQCLFCDTESADLESNLDHMSQEHSFFIPDLEYCSDVDGLIEYLGEKVGEGMVCLWCNGKGKQFYDVKSIQQHMRDKGHCKILHEGESVFEFAEFYDYSSSYPDGAEVNSDEVYQPELLQFNENMQLVLPSGVTLGHRALKVYYRQYIRPGAQLTVHRSTKKNNILSQYRAIGYGSTSLTHAQRMHRDQKVFKQARDKYYMKLGVTGNKTTQHHFRRQVQF